MSWIIGWLSDALPPDASRVLSTIHPQALLQMCDARLCIAAGGLTHTLHHGDHAPPGGEAGWLVSGLGIRRYDDHCSFLSAADWQAILRPPPPDLSDIDGHFIACIWHDGIVEIFSDQLGQRTLYVAHTDRGVFMSTRIDWVARLVEDSSIDFGQLGSRWLTFNQLSYESGLRGVRRLGPGGYGVLTPRSVQLRSHPWQTACSGGEKASTFRSHLSALCNPKGTQGLGISLGLSGGLDSRALLSILLRNPSGLDIHVFGDARDPDVQIARKISDDEGLRSRHFNDPVPDADTCIVAMKDYAAQAYLCEPATSIIRLRYYGKIQNQNKLMIDGGFGELSRRQYLNRLLYRGGSALRSGDPRSAIPFLRVGRAEVFGDEIQAEMERGVEDQVCEVFGAMPRISDIGEGNFLDLLAVRTRIPNWGNPEQARLDNLVLNYMPFVQPSLLRILFSIPVKERSNGRLIRGLIRDLRPPLTGYPLVKGGTTYPFAFNTVEAWFWTKLKSRFGAPFKDQTRHTVLDRIKPFVMDTLESSSVRSYDAYNHTGISKFVRGYYGGAMQMGPRVDWWLTFELWRQSLARRVPG